MPISSSFAGLSRQTAWWHPAREGAVPLWAMEPSHRDYTAKYLARHADTVRREDYRLGFILEDEVAWDELVADEEWLEARPLVRALRTGCFDQKRVNFGSARVTVSLPIGAAFPIANFPLLLIESQDFWLSYRVENGMPRWRWMREGWSVNALDGLAEHFAGRDGDILSSTVRASAWLDCLSERLAPASNFLLSLDEVEAEHWAGFDDLPMEQLWQEAKGFETTFKVEDECPNWDLREDSR